MPDPVTPHRSARIAAKYARLPEVKALFEEVDRRNQTLAAMQTKYIEAIKRNRSRREGKPFEFSKRTQRSLKQFDHDAEKAVEDMERVSATMDDRALLTCELSGIEQAIQMDEWMLPAVHADDKPMAQSIIEHQKTTLRLIEDFIKDSPFSGKVTSIWKKKKPPAR